MKIELEMTTEVALLLAVLINKAAYTEGILEDGMNLSPKARKQFHDFAQSICDQVANQMKQTR